MKKADELTIERTVELCRINTNSDLVKSVLESTSFDSPKEVIAKLITQSNKVKKDAQVLAFRSTKKNFSRNNFSRNKGYYNNNGNNSYNNNGNNNNYRKNRYQGNSGNTGYGNNSQGNNGRNNYGRNNNKNQQGYRRPWNGQSNGQNNNRNVRAYGAENEMAPQHATLGAQQTRATSQNR